MLDGRAQIFPMALAILPGLFGHSKRSEPLLRIRTPSKIKPAQRRLAVGFGRDEQMQAAHLNARGAQINWALYQNRLFIFTTQ